jgi:hypothetical protein
MSIVRLLSQSANNHFFHLRKYEDGYIFNGTSFEIYNEANWEDYSMPMTEEGGSGYYRADFPSGLNKGGYDLIFYRRKGASPSPTDTKISVTSFNYDGIAEIFGDVEKAWDANRVDHKTAGTFGESFNVIASGSAVAGILSTTQMETNLTEETNNHYNGRIIIWTTGELKEQASDVKAYDGIGKILTFTEITEAPQVGDSFIIV